jgi:superfamily II DNA helicase RecQ
VEAVYKLVLDQQDQILIAPTGWGKSVVFQAVPVLIGGICIMIMPLTLLDDRVSLLLLIGLGYLTSHVFCRPDQYL